MCETRTTTDYTFVPYSTSVIYPNSTLFSCINFGTFVNMSWDSYVDNLIAQSKDASGTVHCDKACIIGTDGAPWTTASASNGLKVRKLKNIGPRPRSRPKLGLRLS